jgi:hypothetical protein
MSPWSLSARRPPGTSRLVSQTPCTNPLRAGSQGGNEATLLANCAVAGAMARATGLPPWSGLAAS